MDMESNCITWNLASFLEIKKKGFCCLAAEEGLLLKPKAEDHLPFHNKKGN